VIIPKLIDGCGVDRFDSYVEGKTNVTHHGPKWGQRQGLLGFGLSYWVGAVEISGAKAPREECRKEKIRIAFGNRLDRSSGSY
jgi:hypothetical protein